MVGRQLHETEVWVVMPIYIDQTDPFWVDIPYAYLPFYLLFNVPPPPHIET